MNYEILASFLLASMALTIAPGPDIIYVLMQSLSNGKKYGLITSCGLVSGILIHTSLVAFGVSAIIRESKTLFLSIKIFGALYLIYLAYKVYKSGKSMVPEHQTVPRKKLSALYKQGFLMNVLNPKVSLFFLAFFPGFLFTSALSNVSQFFILGFIFMVQALLIFGLVSLSAGFVADHFIKNQKAAIILKYMQIVVFLGIALFLLLP